MKTYNDGIEDSAVILDRTRADIQERVDFLKALKSNSDAVARATAREIEICESRIRLLDGQAIHIRAKKT